MPIINEGSYFTCSVASGGKDIRFPIPPGVWPSMDAISKYVNEQLSRGFAIEAKVVFPELEPAKEETAKTEESDLCQCSCSCYSCDCDDCPYRDEPKAEEPQDSKLEDRKRELLEGATVLAEDLPLLESMRPAEYTEEEKQQLQKARERMDAEYAAAAKARSILKDIFIRKHEQSLVANYRE